MSHTPGPWRCDGNVIFAAPVVAGSTGEIAGCNTAEVEEMGFELVDAPLPGDANAAFIVRACNAHDDLLAALVDLLKLSGITDDSLGVVKRAHAVIAKATV